MMRTNWPCCKRAYNTVFIKNDFVERWHFQGAFHLQNPSHDRRILERRFVLSERLEFREVRGKWSIAVDLLYIRTNTYSILTSYCPNLQARMVTICEQKVLGRG
jgi:hypothetical protein